MDTPGRDTMTRLLTMAAVTLALIPLAVRHAQSQGSRADPGAVTLWLPQAIQWKDGPASIPSGAKIAVLEGDPTKEGPFTMRLKLPDGYRIPPHMHPKTERLTVLSGSFHLGMGDKFDESSLRAMPAG